MLRRNLLASFALTAMFVLPSRAQDGPLGRAGRALDNAGKNTRARIENEIDKGQIRAEEREVLTRVKHRVRWDKQLMHSVLEIEALADGTVTLRGSVLDQKAKDRAVDLAQSTAGVTKVIDELAIGTEARVIEVTKPARVVTTPGETKVIVPGETKVIVPKR